MPRGRWRQGEGTDGQSPARALRRGCWDPAPHRIALRRALGLLLSAPGNEIQERELVPVGQAGGGALGAWGRTPTPACTPSLRPQQGAAKAVLPRGIQLPRVPVRGGHRRRVQDTGCRMGSRVRDAGCRMGSGCGMQDGEWVRDAGCGQRLQRPPAHGSSPSHHRGAGAPRCHPSPAPRTRCPTGATCVSRRDLAHIVPTRRHTLSSPAPREPRQRPEAPLHFGGASPCTPAPLVPSSPPRGARSPAPRPCCAHPGPALTRGRCRSAPKGPEAHGAPAPDGGVTRGTAPQLPGWGGRGTRPRSRRQPGARGDR